MGNKNAFPKFVISSNSSEIGTVISHSRRCQQEGCLGKRLGVRWNNGKITYPCTKGMTATKTPDTWKIG